MRPVPNLISRAWIDTLSDDDLVDIEARLHAKYIVCERRERKVRGARYDQMRGPAEMLDAWDKWSRVLNATRERALVVRRDAVEDS